MINNTTSKIVTPEQIMGNRLDKLWAWAEELGENLPKMENRIAQVLGSLQLQINTVIIALKNAGILDDEKIDEASIAAQKFMEERHQELLKAQQEQRQDVNTPKIVTAEELENL